MRANRHRFRLSGGTELSFVTAGAEASPAIILLHGFPSSARTFRHIVPALSQDAFVIAPDLPAHGESDVLPARNFAAFGDAILELVHHLAVGPRFIYLHDFGAPVGFHIAMNAPELVLGLVIQNANAHRSGFGPGWAATQAYWANPTVENEAAASTHLTFEGVRDQYVSGVPPEIAAKIASQTWEEDWRVMKLPGRMNTQRALIRDYGNYASRFAAVARYLEDHQPPALMLWGRHDAFFDLAEVDSWLRALPRMEAHILDGGHFLLETHAAAAAALMIDFIRTTHQTCPTVCGYGQPYTPRTHI